MEFIITLVLGIFSVWLFFVRRYGSGPKKYIVCRNREYLSKKYVRKTMKLPGLRGSLLKFLTVLANSLVGKLCLVELMLKSNGITMFRGIEIEEGPTFSPVVPPEGGPASPGEFTEPEEINKAVESYEDSVGMPRNTMSYYVDAYTKGTLTPTEVAKKVIAGFEKCKKLNAILRYNEEMIYEMAEASTQRYAVKSPISPIDGVMILVKDEFAVKGYEYSCGTIFLGSSRETESCESVKRLQNLGAVIVGVANMHELGLGTTGGNVNTGFGICHNPYDAECYSGGSSSGCASGLAAGLCTAALGTDGGGSVRIPASFCGVVGLKPTFGRISLAGLRPVTFSVGHAGPLCNSVKDAALLYALMSYPDPEYRSGLLQPPVTLPNFSENISGVRIGIHEDYNSDCDNEITDACCRVVKFLEKDEGCKIQSIEIPELNENRAAHLIVILTEMTTCISEGFDNNYEDLTSESKLLFRLGKAITATDLLQANSQRTRCMNYLEDVFKDVDVIITPSTGHTAPKIHPNDIVSGSLDTTRDMKTMRYMYIGNFAGIPCITVPVGYDRSGMPIGIQVMAKWWDEEVMLKVARKVEGFREEYRKPTIYNNDL